MIITNNEEALRVYCKEVKEDEISSLIATLESELNYANRLGARGIGLAAPQCGIAKHIAIIRLGNGLDINLVNAKLQNVYDPAVFKDEGCLSFPGRTEDTTRFQEVHVINNLIYPHSFVATGMLAVVVAHELGHLNGDLFFDHKIVKSPTIVGKKQAPNEKCVCNSGLKYKRCCYLKRSKSII